MGSKRHCILQHITHECYLKLLSHQLLGFSYFLEVFFFNLTLLKCSKGLYARFVLWIVFVVLVLNGAD